MKFPASFIKALAPIVSLTLAFVGVLQLRNQFWTVGTICILAAVVGFVFSMRALEKSPFTPEETDTLKPVLSPAISWMVVIGLVTISVIYVVDTVETVETDRFAAAAWVAAIILSLILVWRRSNAQTSIADQNTLRGKLRVNRFEIIILSIVLIMAFLVRTIDLSAHPYPWSGDEASIGMEGRRILNGEITNLFDTGWSIQPNWSFVPTAITEMILGENILAVRLTSVIAGTLSVLFVYLLARQLFNPSIALMAAAFLATLPYNVHFSRIGVNNIIDGLMSSLLFWLIAKALQKGDVRYYYSAGLLGGLCIYTYAGTRLALMIGVLIFLFVIIRQRGYLSSRWEHLIAFFAGLVISMAPQAAFFIKYPHIFMGRLGQEGILFNGWLAQRSIQTGQSAAEILINQFTRTTLVFIASPAPGNFLNSPVPYLTVLGSVIFLLGMGYSLAYMFETRYFILLVWFWAVVFLGGVLTLNPPANTRLLMTSPVAAIFMALGTFKVVEYLQKFRLRPERASALIFLAVVSMVSYQNINFYMGEYRTKMYFENANGEYAMEASLLARDLGEDYLIYILGGPRVLANFPTIPFLIPNHQRVDFDADDLSTLNLTPDQKVAFFAVPESRPLLEEIVQKFPGGERGLLYRKPRPTEILLEYYVLAP
ncbi:MAG TPA: glycosyltransferase family 39 protein [Anaerolineales bacterium]|nr:glycosyltransferase family 39 protein [Anaerolineales bacterium]